MVKLCMAPALPWLHVLRPCTRGHDIACVLQAQREVQAEAKVEALKVKS